MIVGADGYVRIEDRDWAAIGEAEKKMQTRIAALEATLERIQNARLDWAMLCQCSCVHCDRFYELVRDTIDSVSETKDDA